MISEANEGFSYIESDNQIKPYASCFATLMNILNTLIGSEILSIPNSFHFSGLIPSVILLTFTGIISYIATIMIARLQNRLNASSINDLATQLYGRKGGIIVSILTLTFTFSCLVAYLVTAGDTISSWLRLLHAPSWCKGVKRGIVMLIYSLILPALLTVPRDLTFLNFASSFAIGALFFYLFAMISKGITMFPKQGIDPTVESGHVTLTIFNTFSIFCVMFALPGIILPILIPYHPSLPKRYRVIGLAFIICYILTIVPGVIGYLLFGEYADQVIFTSFQDKDTLIQITRAGFFIVLNASYPVIGMTVMTELSNLIFRIPDPADLPTKARIICLLICNGPPILIAMVLPWVRPALDVGGSFGGCLTNFFIPPFLWLKQSQHSWTHWTSILSLLFVIFGIVASVIATYEAILDASNLIKEEIHSGGETD